jgi:hypothetical protein
VKELRAGLIAGVVIATGIVAAGRVLAPELARLRKPFPIAGIAIAVGTAAVIAAQQHFPGAALVAIVGVGAVCALPPTRVPAPLAALYALPFALVLGATLDDTTRWLRVLCVIVACAGAVAVARTDDEWRPHALTPWLFAITAGAVFLAVPDTESAAPLFGVALPMALLARPLRLATLGRAGGGAVTVLLVWVAATDGRASDASVVGALACLALLVGLSVGHARAASAAPETRTPGRPPPRRTSDLAVVVTHAALATIAARVGAAHATLLRAVAVAVLVTAVSILAGYMFAPPPAESRPPG